MKQLLSITKALSDANRVRILLMLRERDLCVCQIIEVLGLAPSTVSKHLSLLQQAGLIVTRKEGRWVHCRLPGADVASQAVAEMLEWVGENGVRDTQAREDARHLRRTLKISPETLCQRKSQRQADCC